MDSLVEIAKRLRNAMSDAATGPLIAAAEVVAISEAWDDMPTPEPTSNGAHALAGQPAASYREQAGGGTCDSWLKVSGIAAGGLRFFVERKKATDRLGEASRRTFHHEVAVYVANNVSDAKLGEVKMEIMRGAKGRNGNPLTPSQAHRIIKKLLGHKPKSRSECKRCERLEKLLIEYGLEVPD